MKYIKTYERIRIDDKRNISKILAEYPPGCYMIYTNKSFDWKIKKENIILGEGDKNLKSFKEVKSPFMYDDNLYKTITKE